MIYDISSVAEALSISEAVEYLQRLGFLATPDKLRQYEKAGLLSGPPGRGEKEHRRYAGSDMENIVMLFTLHELGFRRKEIKRYMGTWRDVLLATAEYLGLTQGGLPTDVERRNQALVEAMQGRSRRNILVRMRTQVLALEEIESEVKARAAVRVRRLGRVANDGLQPLVKHLAEGLTKVEGKD